MVVAANAPDVDVLAYTQGEYFALAFRRGITHGLPAQVLLPFAVAGAVLVWDRWVRRRRDRGAQPAVPREVLLLSCLGVLTHPALDWMNVYGMRWWLPFDGRWVYGDALFIIDPWLWLVLGGAVFLAGAGGRVLWAVLAALTTLLMMAGLVPLGASAAWVAGLALVGMAAWRRGGRGGGEGVARGAVAVAALYLGLMMAAGGAARRGVLRAAAEAGLSATDVMVSPSPANPFAAEVEVATATAYVPGEHRWLPRPTVTLRTDDAVPLLTAPPGADGATVQAILAQARRVPDARHFLTWSRYPYAVVRRDGDAWAVRWSDARYDGREGGGSLAGVEVRVAGAPRPVTSVRRRPARNPASRRAPATPGAGG